MSRNFYRCIRSEQSQPDGVKPRSYAEGDQRAAAAGEPNSQICCLGPNMTEALQSAVWIWMLYVRNSANGAPQPEPETEHAR
jgi:hypothetical protein